MLTFGVRIEDEAVLEKVYNVDRHSYVDEHGRATVVPFERFREWWREFPSGFSCAFEDAEPVAVVGLFPVTQDWGKKFLHYEADELDLSKNVINCSAGTSWYLSGLSTNRKLRNLSTHLPCILGFALVNWIRVNGPTIGARD